MTEFIQYAVLGLGVAATYVLMAQGLVITYIGSGVLNFAQGALMMLGAYFYWEMHDQHHWVVALAIIASCVATGLVGAAIYFGLMRPLRNRSAVIRVVATLGVLLVVQSAAILIWSDVPVSVAPILSTKSWIVGGVYIPRAQVVMLGIGTAITFALWWGTTHTRTGLALRAASENERAAETLGWAPTMLGSATWATGGVLAALAGVLIAPQLSIDPSSLPLIIIPVMAAALVGGLRSLPLTFLGAVVIGVLQAILVGYYTKPGAEQFIPFVLIIIVLAIRGGGLPVRGYRAERLPDVGTGKVSWPWALGSVAVGVVLISTVFGPSLNNALSANFGWAVVMLSIVVVFGYAGQLSLAQAALAGLGALAVARLIAAQGWPFEAAFVCGVLVAIAVGVVFSLPALTTRGTNLAIVTLGLALTVEQAIFGNPAYVGNDSGTIVGGQSIFGFSLDAFAHPGRYASFAVVLFAICALAVARIRRGPSGRRMLAVKINERAAGALGINIFATKIWAFAWAAGLAGIGGILLGFQYHVVTFDQFDTMTSISTAAFAVIGGTGFLLGPVIGGQFMAGSFGAWLMTRLFPGAPAEWLSLVGGVCLLGLILLHPDGIVGAQAEQYQKLKRWVARITGGERTTNDVADRRIVPEDRPAFALDTGTLRVDDLVVRFGGVTAVSDLSLVVEPGEIVGLIGPNGAGKTTAIDAITGFVKPAAGSVLLDGEPILPWRVHQRARAGVSRSFQSLELFERSTVLENLQVAADPRPALGGARREERERVAVRHELMQAVIDEFGLAGVLEEHPESLPYGVRRLLAIARAIVSGPKVLLLDEPAAGLSETEALELREVVRRLAADWGLGILLVEHDMGFVMSLCDRLVVLDFGATIAVGPPEEIRSSPAVITTYLGRELAETADR